MNMSNSTNSSDSTDSPFTADCTVFTIIVDGVLLGGLVLLSIFGNTVSLLTWRAISHVRGLSSTVIMLQCLAVSDTLLVIPVLFVTVIPLNLHLVHPNNSYARTLSPYIIKYIWPCSTTANFVTVWITTLISVHRFHAVCYPFATLTLRLTSVRSTCIQLISIVLFAVTYNIPRFLEFDVISMNTNTSDVEIEMSAMLQDPWYQILYRNVSYIVLMSALPLLLTSVLTVKIVQTVRKASDEREQMTMGSSRRQQHQGDQHGGSREHQRSISLLLVTLIIIFLICQTPTAIVRILLALKPRLIACGSLMFYFQEICLLMVTLNSSTNILVYATCSADFRSAASRILCRGDKEQMPPAGYTGLNGNSTGHPRRASQTLSMMDTRV